MHETSISLFDKTPHAVEAEKDVITNIVPVLGIGIIASDSPLTFSSTNLNTSSNPAVLIYTLLHHSSFNFLSLLPI